MTANIAALCSRSRRRAACGRGGASKPAPPTQSRRSLCARADAAGRAGGCDRSRRPGVRRLHGKTLYMWPISSLRNGYAGDPKDKSVCEDKVTTKTGGYMSPYPPGLDLPDLDRRKSCVAEWTPVLADADAKPVGDWTVITRQRWHQAVGLRPSCPLYLVPRSRAGRRPGRHQYLSSGRRHAGGTLNRSVRRRMCRPVSWSRRTVRGRMLLTDKRYCPIYVSDKDAPQTSPTATGACAACGNR